MMRRQVMMTADGWMAAIFPVDSPRGRRLLEPLTPLLPLGPDDVSRRSYNPPRSRSSSLRNHTTNSITFLEHPDIFPLLSRALLVTQRSATRPGTRPLFLPASRLGPPVSLAPTTNQHHLIPLAPLGGPKLLLWLKPSLTAGIGGPRVNFDWSASLPRVSASPSTNW